MPGIWSAEPVTASGPGAPGAGISIPETIGVVSATTAGAGGVASAMGGSGTGAGNVAGAYSTPVICPRPVGRETGGTPF